MNFKQFLGIPPEPATRAGILPGTTVVSPDDLVASRRDFLKGAGKLAAVAAIGSIGASLSKNVEAAPNIELRKELIDNHTIFTDKADIISALEKYEKQNDLRAFNFYYPRYIGEQNPNITRIAKSLIVSKVMVKNLDDRVVEVPLLNGEILSTLSDKIVVKAEIVGGNGWIILPAGTQVITGADGKRKIAACRNDIHEEIKEEEKKCIPKCVAVKCNYPETVGGVKTGKSVSVVIPFSKERNSDSGKNICQSYMESNISFIKSKFNEVN